MSGFVYMKKMIGTVSLRKKCVTVLEFEPGPIRSQRRLTTNWSYKALLKSLRLDLMDPGSNPWTVTKKCLFVFLIAICAQVVCKVQEEDYQFKNHMCSLILPICLIVREVWATFLLSLLNFLYMFWWFLSWVPFLILLYLKKIGS